MKKRNIDELEKQHAAGYARIPSQPGEFEEWESEQVWPEDEEGKPDEAVQQPMTTGTGTKAMKEALEKQQRFATNSKDGTTAIVLNLCARIVNDEMRCRSSSR